LTGREGGTLGQWATVIEQIHESGLATGGTLPDSIAGNASDLRLRVQGDADSARLPATQIGKRDLAMFTTGEILDPDSSIGGGRLDPHQPRAADRYFASANLESNRCGTGALRHESLPMRADTYKGSKNAL
jgi:hypothetical protein